MNKIISAVVTSLLLGSALINASVHAADAPPAAAKAEAAQGKGTVVKVDAAAGVLNLNHEAIAALKWPAMTMDFKVTDKKLLANLKPGQTINFGLVKDATLGYIIARIEIAK